MSSSINAAKSPEPRPPVPSMSFSALKKHSVYFSRTAASEASVVPLQALLGIVGLFAEIFPIGPGYSTLAAFLGRLIAHFEATWLGTKTNALSSALVTLEAVRTVQKVVWMESILIPRALYQCSCSDSRLAAPFARGLEDQQWTRVKPSEKGPGLHDPVAYYPQDDNAPDIAQILQYDIKYADLIRWTNATATVPMSSSPIRSHDDSCSNWLWDGPDGDDKGLIRVWVFSHLANSQTDIQSLSSVTIDELMCPSRAEGQKLHLRVVTPVTIYGLGLVFVVEDTAGRTALLNIEIPLPKPTVYYSRAFLNQLYPIGSVMTLKEPGVRFSYSFSLPELFVGMPCDIQLELGDGGYAWTDLNKVHGFNMGISEAKEIALELLDRRKEPYLAHLMYERILSSPIVSPAERAGILLSHSHTSLLSGLPGSAYRDLKAVDKQIEQGARLNSKQLCKHTSHLEEAARELRIDPKTGRDIALTGKAKYPSEFRFDGANWGLFATRDIELGETVRPPGYHLVAVDEDGGKWEFWYKPNKADVARTTAQMLALCKSVHELIDDPRKAGAWAALHPRQDTDRHGDYAVDRALPVQFAISAARLCDKFARNSSGKELSTEVSGTDIFGREASGAALDPVYSKINHSCLPDFFTFPKSKEGDPERSVAFGKIAKGKQIFTTYSHAFLEPPERDQGLQQAWGFQCECKLCHLDRRDDSTTRYHLKTRQARETAKKEARRHLCYRQNFAAGIALVLKDLAELETNPPQLRLQYVKECLISCGIELVPEAHLGHETMPFVDVKQNVLDPGDLIMFILMGSDVAARDDTLSIAESAAWCRAPSVLADKLGLAKRGPGMTIKRRPIDPKNKSRFAKDVRAQMPDATDLFYMEPTGSVSDAESAKMKAWVDNLPEEEKLYGEPQWKMVNGEMQLVPTIRDTPFARNAMKMMADFMAQQGGDFSIDMDFSDILGRD